MAKNTVTISISIPKNVDKDMQKIANELNVSKSAVATGILSLVFKWEIAKEVMKNAVSRW